MCQDCLVALSGFGDDAAGSPPLMCEILSAAIGVAAGAGLGAALMSKHRGRGAGIGLAVGGLVGGVVGMFLCKPKTFPGADIQPSQDVFAPAPDTTAAAPAATKHRPPIMTVVPSTAPAQIAATQTLRKKAVPLLTTAASAAPTCGMHMSMGPDGVCREVLY